MPGKSKKPPSHVTRRLLSEEKLLDVLAYGKTSDPDVYFPHDNYSACHQFLRVQSDHSLQAGEHSVRAHVGKSKEDHTRQVAMTRCSEVTKVQISCEDYSQFISRLSPDIRVGKPL